AREQETIFIVRVSYVELYNNNFRNLLQNMSPEQSGGGSSGGGGSGRGGRGAVRGGGDILQSSAGLGLPLPPTMTYPPPPSFSSSRATNEQASAPSPSSRVNPPWPSSGSSTGSFRASGQSIHSGRGGKIEVRESRELGVFLSGPGLHHTVTSAAEAMRLVAAGDAVRATGPTDCNEHSSRSHAILSLHRLSLSGSEGQRLNETQNINLSLSSLGDVLASLSRNAMITGRGRVGGGSSGGPGVGRSEGAAALAAPVVIPAPVPYRNSKLTHFLKDSLGGNSKTLMVTNLRSTPPYHRQ
ncbi:unnamed protein product, partial [Discosporangium mesarthrocarpum]